jgi:hypothetical protein
VAGGLPAAAFFAAPDPLSSLSASGDGRFLYDTAGPDRGTLYWDANGGNAADAVAFARLTGGAALTASDFSVI